jgi:hypothetical protein
LRARREFEGCANTARLDRFQAELRVAAERVLQALA